MNRINTWIYGALASLLLLAAPAAAQKTVKINPVTPENGIEAPGRKLTVMHFWATWCAPCVAELPELDAFARAHPDLGVMALSMDDGLEKVKFFFTKHNIATLKPTIDEGMVAFRKFRVRGLPTTLFINEQGQVFARADGELDWKSREVAEFIESRLR